GSPTRSSSGRGCGPSSSARSPSTTSRAGGSGTARSSCAGGRTRAPRSAESSSCGAEPVPPARDASAYGRAGDGGGAGGRDRARARRGARLPVARAGCVRDGRGRVPAPRGRPDHGGRRARARGQLARARRVRRARGRGRAGVRRGHRRRVSSRGLPVLVAPDSFKGTLAASRVAAAVAAGLRDSDRDAVELPVADGGEGTMDALVGARGGERRRTAVSDPLGRPVEAEFALLGDGELAVVEMARASGLDLVLE